MSVLSIVFFVGVLSVCHSVTVYVDESASSNDCAATTINTPCNNLTASLEFVHATSIAAVYIAQGSYSLLPSEKLKFKSVSSVTIAKLQGSNGTVHVNCAGMNAGLSFLNVTGIHIQGIEFSGCGVVHNSTSRNFSVDPSFSLLNITVSLYFESCQNVNLLSITVTQSLGVAVQFFSTSGLLPNEIKDCEFSNNTVGGGLNIEFPYCIPGDNTCDQNSISMVDIASVSNSVYTISNCIFRNNIANSEDNGRTVLPYQSYHEAQGRGGGLSIFFKGNAKNNKFNISNCTFENNSAVYGGGMYVEMQDLAMINKVETNALKFWSNNASIDGGGLLASYIFLKTHLDNLVSGGSIILKNAEFYSNYVSSGKGGGVSFTTTRQNNTNWNNFMIINTTFVGNKAFLGSAVQIGAYSTEMNGLLCPVQICDVTVKNNSISKAHNKLGTGAIFVQSVPVNFSGNIEFTNNTIGSGLTAYQSNIIVTKNTSMLFQDNIGHNGGALSLHDSTIIVNEGCSFVFIENMAYIHGGAIYASFSGPDVQVMSQDCFIQYYDITLDPTKWDASFIFQDNKMPNHKVNSIYATSLKPCLFGRAFGVFPSENDHQKLQELFYRVFCWNRNNSNPIWKYNGSDLVEDCNYHIDTGLNHFSINSNAMTNIDIVPGKVTFLDLQGIDDQGEPIRSEIILHARSIADDTEIDKDYKYTSSSNIVLLKKREGINQTELNIETIGQEVPLVLRISARILDCPPGFHLHEDGKCKCMKDFRGIIKCDDSRFTAFLLSGYWMGIYNHKVVVSHCRDCNTSLVHNGYYNLSQYANYTILDKSLCGENREGVSCSTCVDKYAPAINLNEFKCVECSQSSSVGGVFLFLLLDFVVPLSLLAIVYVLDVPLTNGLLHGPIFFAQMITTVVSLDGDGIIHYKDIVKDFNVCFEQVYFTLYDIFNLDFFMSFQNMCLGNVNHYATIVSIHYASALLPLLFVLSFGLFIFLFDRARRFQCINSLKNCMKSRLHNLPNILATCILLSYTKVMVITCYLLTPIVLIGEDGKFNDYRHSVLYIDGSIRYTNKEYYPYLVAPIIVALCFLIPVPIFLAVFRSNDAGNNSGFFNNLLEQFQKEFRQSKEDFPMFNRDESYVELDERSASSNQYTAITRTFCDPYKGCGGEIDNRTEYERECCSPQYLCRYYQKKSRYCPIAINTSWSFYDYRWFAGGFFALRVLLIVPYVLAWTTMIRYSCQLCICMFGGMFIILVRPYKRKVYKYFDCNRVEALSLFNLGFILALCIYQYQYTTNMKTKHSLWAYVIQVFLVIVPFVWIVVVYVYLMKQRHSEKYDKWIRPCLRWCCGKPDRHSNNNLSERHDSGEDPTSVRLINSNSRSKSRSQTWSQSRSRRNDYVNLK